MSFQKKIYGVLFNKCPRCNQGDFFVSKSAYDLRNFDKMHKQCSHCGENFEPEPGFYWGSMYMSYAFYVVYILAAMVVFNYSHLTINSFLAILIGSLLVLMPLFFRLARRSWLAIFTGAEKPKIKEGEV